MLSITLAVALRRLGEECNAANVGVALAVGCRGTTARAPMLRAVTHVAPIPLRRSAVPVCPFRPPDSAIVSAAAILTPPIAIRRGMARTLLGALTALAVIVAPLAITLAAPAALRRTSLAPLALRTPGSRFIGNEALVAAPVLGRNGLSRQPLDVAQEPALLPVTKRDRDALGTRPAGASDWCT